MYLRGHEGRGIGIGHKMQAYALQDAGLDTVDANLQLGLPADSREYGIGAQILVDLGVTTMRLMTNNTAKYGGLEGFGLEITGRVPLVIASNPENERYLATKRERMGHLFDYDAEVPDAGPAEPRPTPSRWRPVGRDVTDERVPEPDLAGAGAGLRIAVVCGRFNGHVTLRLLDGVRRGLAACGVADDDVRGRGCRAPSSSRSRPRPSPPPASYDAVVAVGCVIRGDTAHFEYVAGQCAEGLQRAGLDTGVPVRLRRAHHRGPRAGARPQRGRRRPQRRRGRRPHRGGDGQALGVDPRRLTTLAAPC